MILNCFAAILLLIIIIFAYGVAYEKIHINNLEYEEMNE